MAEYLTKEEGRGHAPPVVVRGDMDRTRDLIDSIARQWTYTHGVLSFAAEDAPTEDQQREAMDLLERLSFAGLDREQYDITWVRHTHTESGRVELHFVTPRMELNSGKALNIAPPGWENTYATLRDTLNLRYDWSRPDDPERARELTQAPERVQEGFRLREGREGIHGYLTALVASESITDRASMVLAVRDAGLEVTREGKDYITVRDPASDERFRMKGRIYEKDWTYDRELDRAIAPEGRRPDSREREDHQRGAYDAYERYQEAVERRAGFNSERYHRHESEDQRGFDRAEMGQPVLVGRVVADVDRGRGLVGLALDDRGRARSHELDGLSDFHARRSDLSDRASRQRGGELPVERQGSGLHSVAARGVTGDEREADGVRARLAGTVRNIGDRLRERLGKFGERVREFARAWQEHEGDFRSVGAETNRSRTEAAKADRSLRHADEAHRGLEGAIRGIGEAGERVAGRVTEMTRERAERDWQKAMTRPDRGLER